MEVSKRTLGSLAAVAIGLTFILLGLRMKPALRPWLQPTSPERLAVRALSDSVFRLTLLVGTARVRDMVDSVLQRYPAGKAPPVIAVGRGALAMVPRAESLLSALQFDRRSSVAVHVVLVDSRMQDAVPDGWVNTFTLLPGTSGGVDCAAVRVVFPGDAEAKDPWDPRWDLAWGGTAGPCWYLARFGLPGPAVREWLDARYWDVAGVTPVQRDSFAFRARDDVGQDVMLKTFGEVVWSFRSGSVLLEGCVRDRPELCEAAFLRPLRKGVLPDGIGSSGEWSLYRRSATDWSADLPWHASRTLLAMMVENLGPTRFAAFWTSSRPVTEAFEAAAGMSMGEWYRGQLRRELRRAGVPDPREAVSWPSALGLLALALGAALWHAGRRQIR